MIEVSKSSPVNIPGEPTLTRSKVWAGLVMKANNALPFVPAMTHCDVTQRDSDVSFEREIMFRGDKMLERVTLTPERTVLFERLRGPVMGNIRNDIEQSPDGELSLRFSFSLVLEGVTPGSPEEQAYAKTMEADYFKAVDATLGAIRRLEREGVPA